MPSSFSRFVTRASVSATASLRRSASLSVPSNGASRMIQGTPSFYAAEDDLPSHHRVPHLRFEQLRLRHGIEIAFDHGEVREFSQLDRAARILLEGRIRRVLREAADGFRQ